MLSHDVVTTVRSHTKGQKILDAHSQVPASCLSYVVVEHIAAKGSFDEAVRSDPPFDAVVHTASPFHFNIFTTAEKDLLEPAIKGTVEILKATKEHAPTVRKVVITSSFVAILNFTAHPELYTEDCWNPVTWQAATENAGDAYPGSKTLAEQAAWDYVEKEKPNFTLSVINPPLIYGPIIHHLDSLSAVNTSNTIFRDIIQGKLENSLPPTSAFPDWVDVRDVALAHVRALEIPEAAGKRFILAAGKYSIPEIAGIIGDNFPDLRAKLPEDLKGDLPGVGYLFNNDRSKDILKIVYRPLDLCVIDSVNSLLMMSH